MLWKILAHPVSSASATGPEGPRAQQISPPSSCSSKTKSIAARTVGHIAVAKALFTGDQYVVPDSDRDIGTEVAVAVGVLDDARAKLDRPGAVRALLAPTPVERVARRVDQARCGQRHRAFHVVPRVGVPVFRPWDRPGWFLHRGNRFRRLSALCGREDAGTAGSLYQFNGGYRFLEVHRDALADQRVEC